MDSNLKIILEEFESLKGQFVILNEDKVVRLIGVAEDDLDYYWITYDGRKRSLSTCLCRIIPLKGKIDEDDYASIVRIARLNHWDQIGNVVATNHDMTEALKWAEEHRKELETPPPHDRFLTPICWDIS